MRSTAKKMIGVEIFALLLLINCTHAAHPFVSHGNFWNNAIYAYYESPVSANPEAEPLDGDRSIQCSGGALHHCED